MNRILKRIGGKLRPGLSPDAPPLSSDAPPPDRMTDADYEAFQKARRMLGPWLGMIVAILALATAAPAHADGSTASLTDAARQVYTQVQPRCTPSMAPHFQRITTDGNGHGRIVDSNPSLGGPFDYLWGPNGSPGTLAVGFA